MAPGENKVEENTSGKELQIVLCLSVLGRSIPSRSQGLWVLGRGKAVRKDPLSVHRLCAEVGPVHGGGIWAACRAPGDGLWGREPFHSVVQQAGCLQGHSLPCLLSPHPPSTDRWLSCPFGKQSISSETRMTGVLVFDLNLSGLEDLGRAEERCFCRNLGKPHAL